MRGAAACSVSTTPWKSDGWKHGWPTYVAAPRGGWSGGGTVGSEVGAAFSEGEGAAPLGEGEGAASSAATPSSKLELAVAPNANGAVAATAPIGAAGVRSA